MNAAGLIPCLIGLAIVGLVVTGVVFAVRLERKRIEALAQVAADLGFTFSAARDHDLARQHEKLRGLNTGDNRYAHDVMTGIHQGHRVTLFDFHYETTSTDDKGNSTTSHYSSHVLLMELDRTFPGIVISPEGFLSKIAQAVGYDDIDFESHEFSRRYCVRSADKRFAYDFCCPAMIDFLLDQSGTSLEQSGDLLAFIRNGLMTPAKITDELAFAVAIRDRMPAYLFAA